MCEKKKKKGEEKKQCGKKMSSGDEPLERDNVDGGLQITQSNTTKNKSPPHKHTTHTHLPPPRITNYNHQSPTTNTTTNHQPRRRITKPPTSTNNHARCVSFCQKILPGDYSGVIEKLKEALNDKMIAVAIAAVNTLGVLADGLGAEFKSHGKSCAQVGGCGGRVGRQLVWWEGG